jgi:hypothetical protein
MEQLLFLNIKQREEEEWEEDGFRQLEVFGCPLFCNQN